MRNSLLSLPLLILSSLALSAQDHPSLYIGITAGTTDNEHTGNFRIIEDPSCPIFEDASGTGYLVGLSGLMTLDPAGVSALVGRIGYERRPGLFIQELPSARVLLPGADPNEPEVVEQSVSATADITYDLLGAELLFAVRPLPRAPVELRFAAGPAVQYVVRTNMAQEQRIGSPADSRFVNPEGRMTRENGRVMVFYDDEIPNAAAVRFSLKTGLSADLYLFDRTLSLSTGLYYDYGLTEVTSNFDWRVHSLIAQVDVRYGI